MSHVTFFYYYFFTFFLSLQIGGGCLAFAGATQESGEPPFQGKKRLKEKADEISISSP